MPEPATGTRRLWVTKKVMGARNWVGGGVRVDEGADIRGERRQGSCRPGGSSSVAKSSAALRLVKKESP